MIYLRYKGSRPYIVVKFDKQNIKLVQGEVYSSETNEVLKNPEYVSILISSYYCEITDKDENLGEYIDLDDMNETSKSLVWNTVLSHPNTIFIISGSIDRKKISKNMIFVTKTGISKQRKIWNSQNIEEFLKKFPVIDLSEDITEREKEHIGLLFDSLVSGNSIGIDGSLLVSENQIKSTFKELKRKGYVCFCFNNDSDAIPGFVYQNKTMDQREISALLTQLKTVVLKNDNFALECLANTNPDQKIILISENDIVEYQNDYVKMEKFSTRSLLSQLKGENDDSLE